MKKLLLLSLILALMMSPLLAEKSLKDKISLITEVDMYLAYKVGLKYDVSNKLSVVNTFGVNMMKFSQFCYSFYGSIHTQQSESSFNVDVNIGILQGVFNIENFSQDKYFYFNPGVTMQISYPVLEQLSVGAQAGMVFMVGYDNGFWGTSLEPYAGITLIYSK